MSVPVRLEDHLVRHAAAEGQVNRRSTPKQIELWAELGRIIADQVSPEDMIALTQGLKKIRLERVQAQPPTSEALWDDVETARETGELGRQVRQDRVVYQASPTHPGYLEAIHPDGTRETGVFRQGKFRKSDGRDHAA